MASFTYQITGEKSLTSMKDMFAFVNSVTTFGTTTKALEGSFRKRGHHIRRCNGCSKVSLYDYEVLNNSGGTDLVGEWVNRDEADICPFLHAHETHNEYYARTGKKDERMVNAFTAYLHYNRRLSTEDLCASPCAIRQVKAWREPSLGRTHKGSLIPQLLSSKYLVEHELISQFNRLHRLGPYVHLSHPCSIYWNFTVGTCQRYLDPSRVVDRPKLTLFTEKEQVSTLEPLICGEKVDEGFPSLNASPSIPQIEQSVWSTPPIRGLKPRPESPLSDVPGTSHVPPPSKAGDFPSQSLLLQFVHHIFLLFYL